MQELTLHSSGKFLRYFPAAFSTAVVETSHITLKYGNRLILYIWATEYPYILNGSHSCLRGSCRQLHVICDPTDGRYHCYRSLIFGSRMSGRNGLAHRRW